MVIELLQDAFRKIKQRMSYIICVVIGIVISVFVIEVIFAIGNGVYEVVEYQMYQKYPKAKALTCVVQEGARGMYGVEDIIMFEQDCGDMIKEITFDFPYEMQGVVVGTDIDVSVRGVYSSQLESGLVCGRFLTRNECLYGDDGVVITQNISEKCFGSAERSIGNDLIVSNADGLCVVYKVVGVCEENELHGEGAIYASYTKLNETFGDYDAHFVNKFEVTLNDTDNETEVEDKINSYFQNNIMVSRPDVVTSLKWIIDAVVVLLVLASLIIVCVSGMSTRNVVVEIIQSYTKEIGIKKAMGATNEAIMIEYLIVGGGIAMAGVTVGVSVYFVLSGLLDSFFLECISAMMGSEVDFTEQIVKTFIWQDIVAAAVPFIVTMVYCWKAVSKAKCLKIVDAMRKY